jgi:hypothetical protein
MGRWRGMSSLIKPDGTPFVAGDSVATPKQAPRKPINLTESVATSLPLLTEGNKQAETILRNMLRMGQQVAMMILDLDDMNIRGEQIVVLYNTVCGADTDQFFKAIKIRSKDAVRILNNLCPTHRAVTGGASLGRTRYEEYYN